MITTEWKFQQLRESILKEIRILEAGIHTSPIQRTPSFPAYTTAGSFFTQTHRKQHDYSPRETMGHTSKQCTYCKGPHPTRNCSVVNDCQERWAIAKKDKLCFNCLGNHKSANCQSRFRCLKCRGKHHTTLCPNFESPLPPTLPAHPTAHPPPTPPAHLTPHQPLNPPIQQERLPVKPNTQQPRSTHATLVLSIHSPTVRHVSLLKTAVATVSSGQLFCDASIFLDEGAQRSFITTSLANQLGIQLTQTEEISLWAFGAQTVAKRHLPLATVYLVTRTGERIPLHVLIIDKIATPLQIPHRTQMNEIPHLRNLTLAHPTTDEENFNISLLIGADHYWDIVEDQVIRGQGPTAVASKLGYLLSGPLPCSSSSSTLVNFLQTVTSTKDTEFDLERFWPSSPWGPLHHQTLISNMIFLKITSQPPLPETQMAATQRNFPGKIMHLHFQTTTKLVNVGLAQWYVDLHPLQIFLKVMKTLYKSK